MDLFPRVLAQTLDEIASPTIPFEPPGGGSITPTPTALQGPSISLSTQQLAINVGSSIKIYVSINSKGTELGEYAFQITYDPALLQIVDADVSQAGSQIKVIDNLFQVQENTVSQSTGIITFRAKSSTITTTYTDRQVAEIELIGLKEGLGQVSLNKTNSMLLDNNSTDILEAVNSISVTVTKEQQQITPLPSAFPSKLPDNALIDEIGAPRALMLGILLIATGLYIFRYRTYAGKKRVPR